jgi:hypothetical protein
MILFPLNSHLNPRQQLLNPLVFLLVLCKYRPAAHLLKSLFDLYLERSLLLLCNLEVELLELDEYCALLQLLARLEKVLGE